ncbi:mRNA decay activator protein ZFP36L2-B [Anabrus simplex]|uniref:mRNA decay activator protein ZFP36L2-B n=1 Tax=Anabrus simplex TaxID=316456 RepID=UPI0034DD41F6
MSTAVMSSSPLYDFGDFLYKSHTANNNNNSNNRATATTTTTNINMSSSLHQKVLRWGSDSSQRAVGGPVPLGRRSSNPGSTAATTTIAVTASLVSSVSTLILDNMRSETASTAVVHRKLDRSQSEPASAASAVVKAANINTSRYKTELCRPFEENGSCKYGDKCQFAHGAHELRNLVRHPKYKTELCRTFHTIGFCPYGPRCHFIHNADEARNKPKPLELTSTAAESSPTSSLSQSPTNSVGSFFSETDVFSSLSPQPQPLTPTPAFAFGQDFNPLPVAVKSVSPSPPGSPRGTPPPASEARLPVFNRLSSQLILSGLGELLA